MTSVPDRTESRTQKKLRLSTCVGLRNQSFVGRTKELGDIHKCLTDHNVGEDLAFVVIHGLGGQGKTQTALAYYFRYRSAYDAVFWIKAETAEQIDASYVTIAHELRKAGLLDAPAHLSPDEDVAVKVESAREWLEGTSKRWLLIFDNLEDAKLIKTYVRPNENGGSIIITTQRAHISPITQNFMKIDLPPLPPDDGRLLFFRILERSPRNEEESNAAGEICDWVGGLPLAIVTVSGYMKVANESLVKILARLKKSSPIWQSSGAEVLEDYDKTLATVFDLALASISENSRHLLHILAFMSPDGIPDKLLTEAHDVPSISFLKDEDMCVQPLPTALLSCMVSNVGENHRYLDIRKDLGLRQLIKTQDLDNETYIYIHRSLQRNLLLQLAMNTDKLLRFGIFEEVTAMLNSALPTASRLQQNEKDLWPLYTKYVPQVLALHQNAQWPIPPIEFGFPIAQMFSNIGTFLWHTGQIRECSSVMNTAELIIRKQPRQMRSGKDSREILSDIYLVTGILADCIGVTRRRESLEHRQVLLILRERELASKPSAEVTVNDEIRWGNAKGDLACAFLQRNQFKAARAIMEELFEYYTKWGSEDEYPFEYGKYYHHLGHILMAEGEPEKALEYSRRGMELDEVHAQGVDSTVLTSRYDLACLLFNADKIEESLAEHKEVLLRRIELCGKGSQPTLESYEAVAIILHLSGNNEAAREHFEKCLYRPYRDNWTKEGIARAQYWYSVVLHELGEIKAANEQFQEANRVKETLLQKFPEFLVEEKENEAAIYDQMVPIWILQTSGPLQDGGRRRIRYNSPDPPATVDTGTGGESQWIRTVLEDLRPHPEDAEGEAPAAKEGHSIVDSPVNQRGISQINDAAVPESDELKVATRTRRRGRLFDEDAAIKLDEFYQKKYEHAKKFFDLFEKFQDDFMKPISPAPKVRLKIAVLDTGLDQSSHSFQVHREQIKESRETGSSSANGDPIQEVKSFLGNDSSDKCGHGTHVTELILRLAPEADLYIAKIADGLEISDIGKIADAINWATEKSCDIINMSFGFEQDFVPPQSFRRIQEAIILADSKKIIMVAAASNCGGNGPRTYPASDPRVICIHATDGYGNKSDMNPSKGDYEYAFSTLGIAIRCLWDGQVVYKSGTSYATPVATAIVGNVHDYVRFLIESRGLDPGKYESLRQGNWMSRAMKKLMSKQIDGYDYIAPWFLWDNTERSEHIYQIFLNDFKG